MSAIKEVMGNNVLRNPARIWAHAWRDKHETFVDASIHRGRWRTSGAEKAPSENVAKPELYVRADLVEVVVSLAMDKVREDAARLFWAAVCEQRAAERDRDACIMQRAIDSASAWSARDVAMTQRHVERRRTEAAQLRAWAKEAKP